MAPNTLTAVKGIKIKSRKNVDQELVDALKATFAAKSTEDGDAFPVAQGDNKAEVTSITSALARNTTAPRKTTKDDDGNDVVTEAARINGYRASFTVKDDPANEGQFIGYIVALAN